MDLVIISAACCIPGMGAFDEHARRVIDQAILETGAKTTVTLVPVTTAMVALNKVVPELLTMYSQGKLGLPAVLINGEVVSYGVPEIEDMKAALRKFAEIKTKEEESK